MIQAPVVERRVIRSEVVEEEVAEERRSQGMEGMGTMKQWMSRACGPVVIGVVFALGGFSSPAAAQNSEDAGLLSRRANLGVEGVSIIDALRRLQARSAVPIGFSPESIPSDVRVSCSCMESTVQEALEVLLEGTGLIFTGRRSQILVTRPNAPEPPRPETGIVSGIVREVETGMPIASARVELRELRIATMTRAHGRFIIQGVPPGAYTVDVDALGVRREGVRRTEITLDRPAILELELMRDPLAARYGLWKDPPTRSTSPLSNASPSR